VPVLPPVLSYGPVQAADALRGSDGPKRGKKDLAYLIKRLFAVYPDLIGVVSLVFLILHATPKPATRVLGRACHPPNPLPIFERRWGLTQTPD